MVSQTLEGKFVGIASVGTLIFSIFLLSGNITGRVIFNLSQFRSNMVGAVLFVLGLIWLFFYIKSE